MDYKYIEVLNPQTGKMVKVICIHYEQFQEDCKRCVLPEYYGFRCNPKNGLREKVVEKITEALYMEIFYPDLFCIRLNRKQCICNSQIDYTFELMDSAFFEKDPIRQGRLSEEIRHACHACEVEFVVSYIGMNL